MALREWVSPNAVPEFLAREGGDQDSQLATNLKRWVTNLQNATHHSKPLPNSLVHWSEVNQKCKDQSESFAISTLKVHADCASYLATREPTGTTVAAGENPEKVIPELSQAEQDVFATFSEELIGNSQVPKIPGNSVHIETALPNV